MDYNSYTSPKIGMNRLSLSERDVCTTADRGIPFLVIGNLRNQSLTFEGADKKLFTVDVKAKAKESSSGDHKH